MRLTLAPFIMCSHVGLINLYNSKTDLFMPGISKQTLLVFESANKSQTALFLCADASLYPFSYITHQVICYPENHL